MSEASRRACTQDPSTSWGAFLANSKLILNSEGTPRRQPLVPKTMPAHAPLARASLSTQSQAIAAAVAYVQALGRTRVKIKNGKLSGELVAP